MLLYHKGRGKERKPIVLGDVREVNFIKPLGSVRIEYCFQQRVMAKPLVEDNVNCKFVDRGDARISTHSHQISGKLKRMGSNKFVTKLIWEGSE
jgi:hypothetical protein